MTFDWESDMRWTIQACRKCRQRGCIKCGRSGWKTTTKQFKKCLWTRAEDDELIRLAGSLEKLHYPTLSRLFGSTRSVQSIRERYRKITGTRVRKNYVSRKK